MNSRQNEERYLFTVKQFSERHGWPIGGLRHLIFHENTNGLSQVLRRIGRKILIDEQEFFHWIDKQNLARKGTKR